MHSSREDSVISPPSELESRPERDVKVSRAAALRLLLSTAIVACVCVAGADRCAAQDSENPVRTGYETAREHESLSEITDIESWVQPENLGGTFKTILLISVLSLAPALLMMTTSFVRIVVVLSILRQAIGAQQLPSTQIITGLSLFMTFLIMAPVWNEVREHSIEPYTRGDGQMSLEEAWESGVRPIKGFMSRQIDVAKNVNDIWLFYQYLPEEQRLDTPQTYNDIPIQVLLPAFVISELKIAFLIGFQIYMPFLVIDLVVTSVATSMGMVMLPPTMISLPLKLLLFVLTDGWNLIVGMLMQSFSAYS